MEGTMKENGHMGGPFLGSWDTVLACGDDGDRRAVHVSRRRG